VITQHLLYLSGVSLVNFAHVFLELRILLVLLHLQVGVTLFFRLHFRHLVVVTLFEFKHMFLHHLCYSLLVFALMFLLKTLQQFVLVLILSSFLFDLGLKFLNTKLLLQPNVLSLFSTILFHLLNLFV
jgi:hypothetical protein